MKSAPTSHENWRGSVDAAGAGVGCSCLPASAKLELVNRADPGVRDGLIPSLVPQRNLVGSWSAGADASTDSEVGVGDIGREWQSACDADTGCHCRRGCIASNTRARGGNKKGGAPSRRWGGSGGWDRIAGSLSMAIG